MQGIETIVVGDIGIRLAVDQGRDNLFMAIPGGLYHRRQTAFAQHIDQGGFAQQCVGDIPIAIDGGQDSAVRPRLSAALISTPTSNKGGVSENGPPSRDDHVSSAIIINRIGIYVGNQEFFHGTRIPILDGDW